MTPTDYVFITLMVIMLIIHDSLQFRNLINYIHDLRDLRDDDDQQEKEQSIPTETK